MSNLSYGENAASADGFVKDSILEEDKPTLTIEELNPVEQEKVLNIDSASGELSQIDDTVTSTSEATIQIVQKEDLKEFKEKDNEDIVSRDAETSNSFEGSPEADEKISEDHTKEEATTKSVVVEGGDFLDDLLAQAETREPEELGDATIEVRQADADTDTNSDGDSSSGSDDDTSDSGDEKFVDAEDFDDEEEDPNNSNEPVISKNEIVDEVADELPEDFTIGENDPIEHIGEIQSAFERNILIKGKLSGEFRFLKEGSILCLEDKTPLGYLFEIFGPVSHPLYRIRFNKEEDFLRFKDKKKEKVFYVVPKSSFVYTETIKSIKGSDASNWHDEELPEEEQEFSDDEKEMESKKSKKKKKRTRNNKDGEPTEQESSERTNKKPTRNNRNSNNPKWQNNNQTRNYYQPQHQYQNQAVESVSQNLGYQSRSQREQLQTQSSVQLSQQPNVSYPQRAPYGQLPIAPNTFQPPPQMINQPFYNQFPVPPFPPLPLQASFTPGTSPDLIQQQQQQQQMQQFFQMQQMLMQQYQNNQQAGFYQNPQGDDGQNPT